MGMRALDMAISMLFQWLWRMQVKTQCLRSFLTQTSKPFIRPLPLNLALTTRVWEAKLSEHSVKTQAASPLGPLQASRCCSIQVRLPS